MKLSLFGLTLPALLLALSACNKTPPPDTPVMPATSPTNTTNIVGMLSIVDHVELNSRRAYVNVQLTGTHRTSGELKHYASSLSSDIQPKNISFSLPVPAIIDPDVNYGLSIELISGNSHPGFAAWFPLDLNHYNGELLNTRLFPLNSSTLVNYQILAFNCGAIALDIATDRTSMWLNANGHGHFLSKTEAGSFANSYARYDETTQQLWLGKEQYQCEPNRRASSFAKKRFAGAIFTAISRKDGWAITVYNHSLELVSRRGLQTQLKALPYQSLLNGDWELQTSDTTVSIARSDKQCEADQVGFKAHIDGKNYAACGNKLR